MKIKLITAEYIMIAAFILMLSCHAITVFLVSEHTSVARTNEEAVAIIKKVEQNPLAAFLFQFKKISYLYSLVFVPAMFTGIYYFIRKRYWHNPDVLYMVTLMVASMFIINFFNDFAYLLGYLIR